MTTTSNLAGLFAERKGEDSPTSCDYLVWRLRSNGTAPYEERHMARRSIACLTAVPALKGSHTGLKAAEH